MIAQCCAGGGPSRRLARRLYGATASILPGALLVTGARRGPPPLDRGS